MKLLNKIPIITLICLSFCFQRTIAMEFDFQKLLPEGKPSFGAVTGIIQDELGFMWFSTKSGLYKYDGKKVTSYVHDPSNTNSLVDNILISIYLDSRGDIWIGTLGFGLDRFNPRTGNFTHFKHNSNNPSSIANDTINDILEDKEGNVWIATQQGLDRFDTEKEQFIHHKSIKNKLSTISDRQVRTLYVDRKGTLWVGTGSPYPNNGGGPMDGGLNRYNPKTETFTRFQHDPDNPYSLSNNKISAIYEDNNGVLWVGTANNMLHIMKNKDGSFERMKYESGHTEKLSIPPYTGNKKSEAITFITQDSASAYWLGTNRSGLFYFNPKEGSLVQMSGANNRVSIIRDERVRTTHTSRDGIIWFGTNEGNIYHIDPVQNKLKHTLYEDKVNCFYQDADCTIWVGTDNNLGKSNKNGEDLERVTVDNNEIRVIYKDKGENIWIGTNHGLYLFDKIGNKPLKSWKNDPKNPQSISNSTVYSIFEDSNENLWIGSQNGLNLLDRPTGLLTRFYAFPSQSDNNLGPNFVSSIIEDHKGNIWTSNWKHGGVNLFNPENKSFKHYLQGTNVAMLLEDHAGELWAGTIHGLYRFNTKLNIFEPFNIVGFKSALYDVKSIREDKEHNLWLTTQFEIISINQERDELSVFGQNYGLNMKPFTYLSAYVTTNNEIFFGCEDGYYSFFPSELTTRNTPPEIVFAELHLGDVKITEFDGGPLKERLNDQKELRLKNNQNIFSIDLALIDYSDPEKNHLSYMLENYDLNWKQENADAKAYYFDVPAGEYTFRVKGVNYYGIWAEKEIRIVIMPPLWKTRPAYLVYALLLFSLIFAFDRYKRKRIIQKEHQKSQERELAQAKEIEKAYSELKATQAQLIQSEKMASLGELTAGIAHEIQNPLNFVNNFSEVNKELLEEMNEEIEKGNYDEVKDIATDLIGNEEKINYHGKRADSIVKGMLQHSRSPTGQKELTDINKLADEYLRLAYHGLRAKDKSFNATMNTIFDETLDKINVIPQDMGRVILNLITNAFYVVHKKQQQQPSGYEPTVTVATRKTEKQIVISVEDNGSGIPQSAIDKIFQPFFTTKPSGEGTGLGLSMSYEIVTKTHGGELKVTSTEGQGAVFTILLPL